MRRLVIVVSAALLAASRVNCANSPGNNVPSSPSALVENTTVSAMSGAGKGRKDPTTSSLTLVMVSDINGDGLPNWGDSVTFDVSTTETWNQVNVTCYQNGVGVFGAVLPWTPSRDVVVDRMAIGRSRLHRRVDGLRRQEDRHARVVELPAYE